MRSSAASFRLSGYDRTAITALRGKSSEPLHDLWKQEELDLIVAGTRKMESPLRERLRVLTMFESGARAGEQRGLQLGDFDLYRKTIVVTGKLQAAAHPDLR